MANQAKPEVLLGRSLGPSKTPVPLLVNDLVRCIRAEIRLVQAMTGQPFRKWGPIPPTFDGQPLPPWRNS